jgi:hypothetical protein
VAAETLVLRFAAAHTLVVVGHARMLLGHHDADAREVLTHLKDDGMIRETARLRGPSVRCHRRGTRPATQPA